jgi:hypothetical protein
MALAAAEHRKNSFKKRIVLLLFLKDLLIPAQWVHWLIRVVLKLSE